MDAYHVWRWLYLITAPALTVWLNRTQGIGARQTLGAFAVGVPAALAGGHLLNVFEAWPSYRHEPQRIADILTGGSSIYGALALGLAAGVAYLRWRRIPVRRFLDAAAPSIALGETMTRLGCFSAGCCFGRRTDAFFGVTFPRGSAAFMAQVADGLIPAGSVRSLPVHPTQLYSAMTCGVLFALLLAWFLSKKVFPGAVFAVCILAYGVQRLTVGHWRADAALYWWEVSPLLSILTIGAGATLWFAWRPRRVDRAIAAVRSAAGASS